MTCRYTRDGGRGAQGRCVSGRAGCCSSWTTLQVNGASPAYSDESLLWLVGYSGWRNPQGPMIVDPTTAVTHRAEDHVGPGAGGL